MKNEGEEEVREKTEVEERPWEGRVMNEEIKKKKKIHILISRNSILETIKCHYTQRQKKEGKSTNTQAIFLV